jgi:hypothetical protein
MVINQETQFKHKTEYTVHPLFLEHAAIIKNYKEIGGKELANY